MTDWNALENEMGGKYKKFYADGPYEAKCDNIEIKEVGQNGSLIMKFHLMDGEEGSFPTIDHWLTFKEGKDNFRKWHNRCLMMVLGATKDAAQKAVDVCETSGDKDKVTKAYEAAFKKLLAKKPTIKVEVYTDEKGYARAEFMDKSVAFSHGNEKQLEPKEDMATSADETISEADLSGLPF